VSFVYTGINEALVCVIVCVCVRVWVWRICTRKKVLVSVYLSISALYVCQIVYLCVHTEDVYKKVGGGRDYQQSERAGLVLFFDGVVFISKTCNQSNL